MKRPTRRFVVPPVFVSQQPSSWLTYMLFGEVSSSRERGLGEGEEGRRTEEHTRGIPNDLGNFGTAGGDREARCRGPKSRGTSTRAKREAPRGPEQGPSRRAHGVFCAQASSRLAFYLGQTGIRLNALIKLLTSFGRPGGHRVFAGPLFCPAFSFSLSFLSRHFGPRIVTRASRSTMRSCDAISEVSVDVRLLTKYVLKRFR